jgi:hypothetical protein
MPHEKERPGNQNAQAHPKQSPFTMHRVDHRSRRSLHRDRDQTAESQGITDAARIPPAGSKVSCQEWAEASLYVGQEKVQPFQ